MERRCQESYIPHHRHDMSYGRIHLRFKDDMTATGKLVAALPNCSDSMLKMYHGVFSRGVACHVAELRCMLGDGVRTYSK